MASKFRKRKEVIQKQDIRRAFDAIAKQFPINGYMQPYSYYQISAICYALKQHVKSFSGKRLFDVGSGPMDKTAVFARLGFIACAADDLSDPWHLLPGMRDKLLKFGRENGVQFHLQKKDSYDVPFEKNSFDVVTSISVVEHLHDSPRHIMNFMGEYLRPNGIIVISMPNAVNLRKRLSVVFGNTNYNPLDEMYFSLGPYRGHVREYTLAEVRYLCEISGFEVLDARTFEHLAQSKLPIGVRQIYLVLGHLVPGFRSGLLVIARKPIDWKPVPEDTTRYFAAIANALPTQIKMPN